MRWPIGMVLAWGFVAAGLLFVGLALWQRAESDETRGWPTTPGRVTETWVSEETVRANRAGRRGRYETRYTPHARYEYTVAGVAHTGDRIAVAARSSPYPSGLQDYHPGQAVTVSYDPAHPGRAVLEPGGPARGQTIAATLGGLALAGVGLLLLWLGRHSPIRPIRPRR